MITASKAGVPDILACFRGKFIAVEVKVGKNKASPLQVANLQLIRQAGGFAIIAYSLEDVEKLLNELRLLYEKSEQ